MGFAAVIRLLPYLVGGETLFGRTWARPGQPIGGEIEDGLEGAGAHPIRADALVSKSLPKACIREARDKPPAGLKALGMETQ